MAPRTQPIIDILNPHMEEHGMLLNFSPGKEAAMYSYAGKCKQQVHNDIWQLYSEGIPFGKAGLNIRPVSQYKHLGGQLRGDGSSTPEIRVRTYAARATAAPLRRAVYKSNAIPDH